MINNDVLKAAKKRLIKEKNKIDLNNPIMIVYKISNKCNLCCEYCYFESKEIFRRLTEDRFIDFIDFIAEKSKGYIYIAFHGGEPFLETAPMKKIVDVLLRKKYARRVRFSVQTNGTILDRAFFLFCKEKHITIGLSIDGHDEIANMSRINNKNPNQYLNDINNTINFLNFNIIDYSIISVLTKNNNKSIVDFFYYLKMNGVKSWSCNDLINNSNIQEKIVLTAKEKLIAYKNIIELIIQNNDNVSPYNRLYESNIMGWVRAFYKSDFFIFDICSSNPCGLFNHMLSIDCDGSIYPCDMVSSDEYKITNIYDGSCFNKFELFKDKKRKLDDICKSNKCDECRAKIICKSNCKCIILSGINKERELCEFYLPLYDYLKSILKKNKNIELLCPTINIKNL